MIKTKSLVLILPLMFGLFIVHFPGRSVSAQAKKDNAPSFTLKLLNGRDLKFSELRGKVTVLKFIASWWPECRQEAPAVAKVYHTFKNKDVEFVGIFVRDKEPEVQKFVKTYGVTFPVGLDDGMKIANAYKFVGTPFTVIISKEGEITDRRSGPQSEKALREKIEKLLK
jgi:peroxiredoxin